MVKNLSANARDAGTIPVSGRSPREGNGNSLWYSCLENPMDGGAWRATAQGAKKSRTQLKQLSGSSIMQETWVPSLGQDDPLEKEMATHSSILAWKTPWMEEPSRLQSMGSQRVRHDWVTSVFFLIRWMC